MSKKPTRAYRPRSPAIVHTEDGLTEMLDVVYDRREDGCTTRLIVRRLVGLGLANARVVGICLSDDERRALAASLVKGLDDGS